MLKIEIETGNAAFADRHGDECARILRQLASRLESGGFSEQDSLPLADEDGNRVGTAELDFAD